MHSPDQATELFKALGDSTRLYLLQILSRHELTVTDLVDVLRQPQSTLSRHLKILRDADLIRDRRAGKNVLYSAAPANGNGSEPSETPPIHQWLVAQELPRTIDRRLLDLTRRRAAGTDRFFSTVAHRWDRMRLEHFGPAFPFEALLLLLPHELTVADVGTGTGFLLPTLARRFARVIAVDPVAQMLDLARNRPELKDLDNVSFRRGTLDRLPIDDATVDLALAILVLHHVEDPPAALREFRRILKPGGHLLIVEQQAHRLESFHERMQDRWWGFEPRTLKKWLAEAGLNPLRHEDLLSAEASSAAAPESPDLFALLAQRPLPGTHERR